MVWGAVGLGYKSELIFIDGTLNSQGYIDFLKDNAIFDEMKRVFGDRALHFQQDGASSHTAKKTKKYFEVEAQVDLIPDWPANSPDLSIIENVWGMMKKAIAPRDPKSIDELKTMLKEEWDAIPQAKIDDLIRSTPERMRLCLENDGKSIGHLLNRTQVGYLARQAAQIHLPPGVTIPRKIGVAEVGRTFSICGIVIRNGMGYDPFTGKSNFVVMLQDAAQYVPEGEMPRSIEVIVGDISEEDKTVWEPGAFLRFEVFATAVFNHNPRFREIRSQGSLRIRLEFRKFPNVEGA
jgi:hypothetical protein